MSACGCKSACGCSGLPRKSLCDGDRRNNCWIDGGNPELGDGVCLLDTLSEEQVIYILERNAVARESLKRVTTNPELLELAEAIAPLPGTEPADELQSDINRNAETIPFYSVFQGQPPWNG